MKDILNILLEHKKLSQEQAHSALLALAGGEVNTSRAAAFLTVFMMRNITVEELSGFRNAMLELCTPIDLQAYDPIDLCGTGGDGKNTFNISTAAAFVAAGAGVKVAKHGNNGVSSICGSSNVMAHLGYGFTNSRETLVRQLEEANICFLHAPLFHPAMKKVAPIRKDLGVKTFFNMLGPLVNPAQPKKQLVGVFDLELARLYQYLMQDAMDAFTIVHTITGYDEVSLTAPFKLITRQGETIMTPEELGFEALDPNSIRGGNTVEGSAGIMIDVLKNNGTKAQTDVVVANAALAIHAAKACSLEDAREEANRSLQSGAAYTTLKSLVTTNRKAYVIK